MIVKPKTWEIAFAADSKVINHPTDVIETVALVIQNNTDDLIYVSGEDANYCYRVPVGGEYEISGINANLNHHKDAVRDSRIDLTQVWVQADGTGTVCMTAVVDARS